MSSTTTLQKLEKIDNVNCFFDPLRKDDSFIVLTKTNEVKSGFLLNDEAILESDHGLKWDDVTTIMAGFMQQSFFKKIKETINEANK